MNQPDVFVCRKRNAWTTKFPHSTVRTTGFEHIAFHGEKAYNGVAIISKHPTLDVQKNFPAMRRTLPRRLIAATIDGIRIVNIYVPHGHRFGTDKFAFKLDWIERLRKYFDNNYSPADRVLLCGDLNVAPHEMDVWKVSVWKDKMHLQTGTRRVAKLKKVGICRRFSPDERRSTANIPGGTTFTIHLKRTAGCESTISGHRRRWPKAVSIAGSTRNRVRLRNRAIMHRSLLSFRSKLINAT